MRRAWILSAALAASIPAGARASGNAEKTELSILSFNTWHSFQKYEERLSWAAEEIRRLDPDVVLLQEASEGWLAGRGESTAARLAKLLGYHHIYRPSDGFTPIFGEGLAVLSRYPIRNMKRKKLPHSAPFLFKQRWVLRAEIDHPAGPVVVYNTHLSNDRENPEEGIEQALAVLKFMAKHPSEHPTFLAGDLNAEPDDPLIGLLNGSRTGSPARFVDTMAAMHKNPPPTESPENPHAGTDRPVRIDYLFVAPGGRSAVEIVASDRVLDRPSPEGIYPSDHYGIVARFRFGARKGASAGQGPGIVEWLDQAARRMDGAGDSQSIGRRARELQRELDTRKDLLREKVEEEVDSEIWHKEGSERFSEVHRRYEEKLSHELPLWVDELLGGPLSPSAASK